MTTTKLPLRAALFPVLQFDIVTIAVSAGGIQALSELLPLLPTDFAAALIIVMHLDPNMASLLPQVLNPMTTLCVKDAETGETIQAGTIYTAPPDYHLLIASDRTLCLTQTPKVNFARPSADSTLVSVAKSFGTRAIAVILTGFGGDGTLGIKAIKQHGGRVIVQDPATAAVASMPQTAINTGRVDWVLPIAQIPLTLVKLVQQNGDWVVAIDFESDDAAFNALLDYVRTSRGFDFTGYKRSSLMRRVSRRMQMVEVDTFNDYIDYLEVHPDEFRQLFNTLLINVTSFFRDPAAWDTLRTEILPTILSAKPDEEAIRVWTAGCASGEEAYSVAIVLAELLGIEQFQERVKIYATDLDDDALAEARQATYSAAKVEGLSAEQLEQFFEHKEGSYTFRKDLRRLVIFGRHDLIQDAPISKVDLLLCRNTLMYFNAETQSRILARFHFALRDNGYLFLGKAEMLLTHSNMFIPVQLKGRIFTKVPKPNVRDRLLIMAQTGSEDAADNLSDQVRLREAAFDVSPVARIVLEHNGTLAMANQRVRVLFNLSQRDVGRPLQDLELSYRPVELRSCLQEAYENRRTVHLSDVAWQNSRGESVFLEVQVTPLYANDGNVLGASVSFVDVTRFKRLQAELEHSNQELEMAYEELQSTNEELETTNEELQSANEELETTNEELQSTNEELETMNEELQSANEELQTVNDELQRRSEDLNQSNAFLECVFTSLKGGVVVVNQDFQVQIWNNKAQDLWGLRPEEAVGQNFLNLDIGLPVEQLRQPIRNCLASIDSTAAEITLEAVNRKGRSISCQVTCTPLMNADNQVQGVIMIME